MAGLKDEFLTIEEVAKRMRVSKAMIYRMARKGRIPAIKFGKMWRISSLQLSKLFEAK